jgi:DNA helicase-2/ATP-dependent DNA helicase PcrA
VLAVDELLKDLTEAQRAAATHVDGPLLIVAGPGSGKTRVITRRVAYLISQGIPPASILAITFTNKAAGEMKERVGHVLGRRLRDFGKLDQPWPMICTFHSLCLRILRYYAPMLGLPANFSIYDSADQTRVIKDALKTLEISSTNFSPSTVHGTISKAKNELKTAEAFAAEAKDFYARQVARVYTKYQQLLVANNALDFDDLLLRTTHAMREHPQMLAELQQRFQYVMIDEYQDTNHVQYVLAHAMAMKHGNICVVGDPDQSIYAWRGADIKNILEFERDYPTTKVVRLEQNYRSTKTILAVADKLIANNLQRKKKSLWTENGEGDKVQLILCQDEHDEADIVTKHLKSLHDDKGIDWNKMAIFYRMNALSRVMEDALRRAHVPYQIARGVEFYNRKEIKDVLAYLRVIANPADEVSLDRIINVPTRGIGDSSVKQIQAFAIAHGLTFWNTLEVITTVPGLSTRAVNSIKAFVSIISELRSLAASRNDGLYQTQSGKGLVQTIMEETLKRSGYEAMLKMESKTTEEKGEAAIENINQLITAAAEYDAENPEGSLETYLANVSLVSDADHLKDGGGAVTLMTLHAAKGLEFPVVVMIGLEEGCLPHARARGNLNELEEERRLAFVGITRAQEHLLLTKGAYRTMRGLRERTVTSPFLNELPQEALEVTDRTTLGFGDDRAEYRERFQTEQHRATQQWRRGQTVRHPTFGIGQIADVSNMGQQTRAIVDFRTAGRKTLILEYARLEVV